VGRCEVKVVLKFGWRDIFKSAVEEQQATKSMANSALSEIKDSIAPAVCSCYAKSLTNCIMSVQRRGCNKILINLGSR
jgi:hypothetical protein